MSGKHTAPPRSHTRRSVLLATIPLGLTAAVVVATGDLPKVPQAAPEVTPALSLIEERSTPRPVEPEWEQVVRPSKAPVTSRREAVARESKAKSSPRKVRPRKASRSKRPQPASAGKATALIATSREYFGIPYRWGGKDVVGGLDCSGYTKLVYARHGVNLPHGSRAQAKRGVRVTQPEPGDLLFVRNALGIVHHVAIYAGDGYIHDAPRKGLEVGRRRIWSKPSRTFYRRVL